MRTLQYAAGVVLLALLAVIAYDLHRVANAMQPTGPLVTALFGPAHPATETLAEHDARLRRQQAAISHDLDVILSANAPGPSTKSQAARKPSH